MLSHSHHRQRQDDTTQEDENVYHNWCPVMQVITQEMKWYPLKEIIEIIELTRDILYSSKSWASLPTRMFFTFPNQDHLLGADEKKSLDIATSHAPIVPFVPSLHYIQQWLHRKRVVGSPPAKFNVRFDENATLLSESVGIWPYYFNRFRILLSLLLYPARIQDRDYPVTGVISKQEQEKELVSVGGVELALLDCCDEMLQHIASSCDVFDRHQFESRYLLIWAPLKCHSSMSTTSSNSSKDRYNKIEASTATATTTTTTTTTEEEKDDDILQSARRQKKYSMAIDRLQELQQYMNIQHADKEKEREKNVTSITQHSSGQNTENNNHESLSSSPSEKAMSGHHHRLSLHRMSNGFVEIARRPKCHYKLQKQSSGDQLSCIQEEEEVVLPSSPTVIANNNNNELQSQQDTSPKVQQLQEQRQEKTNKKPKLRRFVKLMKRLSKVITPSYHQQKNNSSDRYTPNDLNYSVTPPLFYV